MNKKNYRKGVGIVVVNDQGQFFLGKRIGAHAWQFPQGGIDEGEKPEEALYRELYEETGIKRDKVEIYSMSEQFAVSEPVFVPRTEKSQEGEGFLLATVYDAAIDKSFLLVLDAENIEKGPIGKAMLDHRVPFGFHGNWKPGNLQ